MNLKSKEKRIIFASIIIGIILLLNFTFLCYSEEPFDKSKTDLGLEETAFLISGDGEKILYEVYNYTIDISTIWLLNNDGTNKFKLLESSGTDHVYAHILSEDGELLVYSIHNYQNNLIEIRTIKTTTLIQNSIYYFPCPVEDNNYMAGGMWLSSSQKELIFTIFYCLNAENAQTFRAEMNRHEH